MTWFVCCYCLKRLDNCKSFSNHMHKCDNDNNNHHDKNECSNNCNVIDADIADAVINDALDLNMTNCNVAFNDQNDDELINSDMANISHDDSDNDFDAANIAERYDNIEVLLDLDSDNEDAADNNSHISENSIEHELTVVVIINDISPHCLQNYKESKINDQSTLSNKHDCCN